MNVNKDIGRNLIYLIYNNGHCHWIYLGGVSFLFCINLHISAYIINIGLCHHDMNRFALPKLLGNISCISA